MVGKVVMVAATLRPRGKARRRRDMLVAMKMGFTGKSKSAPHFGSLAV